MPGPSRWRWLLTALLLAQLLAGQARAQCTIWQLVHDENPENALLSGSMTFDLSAGQCLMIGTPAGGLWFWDGILWRQRAASQLANGVPGWGTLVYDSTRLRAVLTEGGTPQNVWEWTGNTWVRHLRIGPSPRAGYATCFDAVRGRVVLFGGQPSGAGVSPLGDTWEWDGHAWSLAATHGPAPRKDGALTFDAARGKTLLFGGQAGNVRFSDTWEWDGSAWTQVAGAGPEPRYGASMVFDSVRQKAVLFGGYVPSLPIPSFASDTWEWDGTSWTRVALTGPIGRTNGLMAFDSVRARTVLRGGFNRDSSVGPSLQETWEWDGTEWTRRGPTEPQKRWGCSLAYDALRAESIMFGGSTLPMDARSTWAWNGQTWTRRAETGPPARSGHTMTYDFARDRTILFGGRESGGSAPFLGDTWEWDGTSWTQHQVPGPAPRQLHQMVYDQARGRTVLFGGTSGSSPAVFYDDTWEWDGAAWVQLAVQGPSATSSHAMAYDAARQRTVLFTPTQTWEFDGVSWQLALTNPSMMWNRTNAAFAYDAVRQRCVLFGGGGYTSLLEWDGSSWTMLSQFAGPQRHYTPMAFDIARSRFVLFGGSGRGDTWELASSPSGPQIDTHPTYQQVHPGQTVTLSVEASGPGPFTYEWRRQYSHWIVTDGPNGASLYGGTVSGATTPTLTITGVQPSDANNFDHFRCHVTNACGTRISNGAAITLFFCGSPDFDNDGSPGTDADIEAFFACLAGSCCPTCGTADFNFDGDTGTDADIEAFFRVLAGGSC